MTKITDSKGNEIKVEAKVLWNQVQGQIAPWSPHPSRAQAVTPLDKTPLKGAHYSPGQFSQFY
jgi:hypothetical protein